MIPRTFKDNANRTWTVSVVYNSIVDVLAQTGLDLRQLVEDHDHVARELDDPAKLKDVLAILLAEQLESKSISITELLQAITSEAQATAMVTAVYQATFDFFQSQGGVLNDALSRVQRALETAAKTAAHRMQTSIDNGQMDAYLAILMDPNQASQWVLASQNPANTELAAAWQEVKDAELPVDKRLPAFIRLVVERDLKLPAEPPTKAKATKNSSTSSASAGDSRASSEFIPETIPGDNSK